MEYHNARVPTLRPPYLVLYDELKTFAEPRLPSKAGYHTGRLPNAVYGSKIQNTMVKLVFARYFDLSGEDLASCIGADRLSILGDDGDLDFRSSKMRLSATYFSLRSKTFGKKSFVLELCEHLDSLHDFEGHVFNLARKERLAKVIPPNETSQERAVRETELTKWAEAKNGHLNWLSASLAAAVRKAEAELEQLEKAAYQDWRPKKNSKPSSVIVKATKAVEFRRAQNVAWSPELGHPSYNWLDLPPPAALMYSEKSVEE